MKKNEIKEGGVYIAKINGTLRRVRVDRIRTVAGYTWGYTRTPDKTVYDVTNLETGRRTMFRSATKFRKEAPSSQRIGSEDGLCPTPVLAHNDLEYNRQRAMAEDNGENP